MRKPKVLIPFTLKWYSPAVSPNVDVADWETAPPPDPILSRRLLGVRWEIGLVLLGLALFAGLAIWKHFLFYGGYGLISAVLPWYITARTRRAVPAVQHLMDLPMTTPQYPVELNYSCGKAQYGSDTGIIRFDGQWINFEGLQSRFSVRRSDVIVTYGWVNRKATDRPSPPEYKVTLKYAVEGVSFSIDMRPIDVVAGVGKGFRHRFRLGIDEWLQTIDDAMGSTLLPPLEPTAETLARARWSALFGLPVVICAVVTVIQLWSQYSSVDDIAVAVGFLAIGHLLVRAGVLGWLRANRQARVTEAPNPLYSAPAIATETETVAPLQNRVS